MDHSFVSLLTSAERTFADRFKNSLEPVRAIHPTITLQLVYAFLRVAAEESLTVTDLAARCGVSVTAASRHLKQLGSHGGGLGLVRFVPAMLGDLRQHHAVLTPQGLALVQAMMHAYSNGYPRPQGILKRRALDTGITPST